MSKKAFVTYENFDLQKVKVIDKVVDIRYFNLENPNRIEHPEGKDLPHPHLIEAMQGFKEIFALHSGDLKGWLFARDNIKGDLEASKGALDGYNQEVENHNVSGISYIGDKAKGIQITGSKKIDTGSIGYASPRLFFESEVIDYGTESQELFEKVKLEVYNYLFKGKFGVKKQKEETDPNQTSILDEDQQD